MPFELPPLPYPKDALQPAMSAETLEYHHGKHHQAYVTNLNGFVEKDPSLQGKSLEQLILSTSGPVFNNAAQVWNHTFFWNGMKPGGGGPATGQVAKLIDQAFGSFDAFKTQLTEASVKQFGSGWGWLVKNEQGGLEIVTTGNAENPMTKGKKPLLTVDVWEHAYYIDYRNLRAKFIEQWFTLVNWDFVNSNL